MKKLYTLHDLNRSIENIKPWDFAKGKITVGQRIALFVYLAEHDEYNWDLLDGIKLDLLQYGLMKYGYRPSEIGEKPEDGKQ